MAINRDKALALEFERFFVDVERGRLRFFAHSIGEDDPTYTDLETAHAAGHRDLPVPPTFFFSLNLEANDPFGYLDALDIDLRRILHGEQSFTYHAMAYAGDRLAMQSRITDVYDKRGGALEFLVNQTTVERANELVAETTTVIVVRNGEVSA